MDIKNICNYYSRFKKFIEFIPIVEDALENPHWIRKKKKLEDFMCYDLNDVYSHLGEIKEAIDEVKVVKRFGKFAYIDKIICFIYSTVIDFC